MSSIPENTTRLSEKRGFFLRSSSIQKIKCSATYPFRIAGSKLSRDAIKQLLEVFINKARLFSQKALLVLYIATFRILSAVLNLSVEASAKPSLDDEICDTIKKTETELTFRQRILARAIKLQNHKKQIEARTPTDASVNKESSSEICSKPIVTLADNLFPTTTEVKPNKQSYLFVVFVYASAVLIYLQLLILAVALNTTQLPPGLVFLISSLIFIAVIAYKVFLRNKRREGDSFRTKHHTHKIEEKTAHGTVPDTRRSRIRLQKTIGSDLTSKTLSKIKLL